MWTAFTRLGTARQTGFGASPISYTAVADYAISLHMGEERMEFLWDVIKRLDTIWITEATKKTPKKV